MGILAWIIVGLVAGFLAKAIMPGSSNEPGGYVGTALLGIVGALIGGFIFSRGATGLDLGSVLFATLGACIVVGVARLFTRNSNAA